LEYSGAPSYGERIYNQIINSWGTPPVYSTALGSRTEAWAYATAMLLARLRYARKYLANQLDPARVTDLLPVQERKYGLIPGRYATENDRRAALIQRFLLPGGAMRVPVENALRAVLGSAFLAYRVTKPSEIATFPASPGAGPGKFCDVNIQAKIIRLINAVSVTGSPVVAAYQAIDSEADSTITAGDVIVMSANNIGLAEKVTVASSGPGTFTATFTKAHDLGDICTTGSFPYWVSTQGHVLVIVTPAAAADPEMRRKVNAVMGEIMQSVVTWDIVPSTDGVHTDVYTIGDPILGRVGYAGIGSATFP
jgi:hypothetical protein